VTYVDTDDSVVPSGSTFTDNVHPNDTGHADIAANMAFAIPAAVSVSATETELIQGVSGQTLHVQLVGGTADGTTGQWTLSGTGAAVTAVDATDPANPVLTVTAPNSPATSTTLAFVTGGAGANVTLDVVAPSYTLTVNSGSPLERGVSGQTLNVTVGGGYVGTPVYTNFSLSGTSAAVTAGSGTASNFNLTVTAPTNSGNKTLTFSVGNAPTATVGVTDTVAPNSPTGVTQGEISGYSVPVSFTAPSASPAGETITVNAYKNGSLVASNVSSPYTFTGIVDGDVLGFKASDGTNLSTTASVTFTAPTGGGGVTFSKGRGVNGGAQ
jgi:hypothetical protein